MNGVHSRHKKRLLVCLTKISSISPIFARLKPVLRWVEAWHTRCITRKTSFRNRLGKAETPQKFTHQIIPVCVPLSFIRGIVSAPPHRSYPSKNQSAA